MSSTDTPMIAFRDVWKRFGSLDVLKGIDFDVPAGSVTCLIGPSGSGKSTLLRCVNHLEQIDAGRIEVEGDLIGYREKDGRLHEISERDAAKQRADVGMVFQSFNLFPHRTVLANITEAPVKVKGESKAEAEAYARELLDQVGLADKADAWPVQLSGGQQQRVAIARALASEAPVILADEPTGNLDEDTARDITEILKESAHKMNKCVVVVTHSNELAKQADVICRLKRGELQVLDRISDTPKARNGRRGR